MQNLVRSKTIGVTGNGGRGKAGAGPGRDLLYGSRGVPAPYCRTGDLVKVLPWVVDGAGELGAGKTSGAGTRGVDLNAAIGGRTGDSDTNGGESSNNGSKIHVECYPAENPSL